MPLILKQEEESCTLGVWQMDESIEQLCSLLPEAVCREAETRFTAEHRCREWLSVRLLLQTLMGKPVTVYYYPTGRPYLQEGLSLSISHTKNQVAVLLGEGKLGVDVEQYSDRVGRIIKRFVRNDECPSPYEDNPIWGWLLHWCAKEVMYKMLDLEGVDLLEHLQVLPFTTDKEGVMQAREYKTAEHQEFLIHYRLFPDFVLAWSVKH